MSDSTIYFPDDSGDRELDRALRGKVVAAATHIKNFVGDDLLVLEFVDGSSLQVKANFVSRDNNSDINPDLIECQIDVSLEAARR